MTFDFPAAMAASIALALCACATPSTPNAPEAAMTEISAPESVTVTETRDGGVNAEAMAPDMADSAMAIAPHETLLYGAMTKYELTRFVEAVRSLKLESALESDTPMTLFAPNNQAFEFAALSSDAEIEALLKGHIVPGSVDVAALMAAVTENGAPLKLTTLAGTELTVYVIDETVKIAGPSGTLATITQADAEQSNGMLHQINSVFKLK